MGKDNNPPKYDPSGDLAKATKTYLQYLPQLLGAEQGFRKQYDAPSIEAQQGLQSRYGQGMYAQQLAALNQLDPQSGPLRYRLAADVFRDLGSGYNVPPEMLTQARSDYRGAAAAHGGAELGNAPSAADALYSGNVRNQYYQQNLMNAQRFLQGPTPEQQLLAVQPVSPPSANRYVNPAAPAQAAQNNYQNYLAQYQASQGGGSGAAIGQGVGATIGGVVGGIYGGFGGSQLGISTGGAVGGAVGGYFSDAKLKNHAQYVGRSPSGLPIHEFNYEWSDRRYRGVIAQEILAIRPDAVSKGPDGYYRVDYNKIDVDLEEIPKLQEE